MKSNQNELIERDNMLWTVNRISGELLTFNPQNDFEQLVYRCLQQLGETTKKNRVYVWKDRFDKDGEVYCTQIYEWVRGAAPIQGDEQFEEIPYKNLPSFWEATESGTCLNSLICELADSEREILEPQGIQTILIAPVTVSGKRWGFVGIDNCESRQLFTESEEMMLLMSGTMLANTIEKVEKEKELIHARDEALLILNATPLCLNWWTSELENIRCNDEAVRLFELSCQQEYLDRFYELSPEYQPNGQRTDEMALEKIQLAFQEGYCRFEWMHQKLDKTPIPSEITLVRVKYDNDYLVAGFTRDLRELKEMLQELKIKEDDLRMARDEALLSSKAKSNFLANMSHEIRTPMNAISGLAEIILRESRGRKAAEHAVGIKNACTNLLNIINDILDISKIESGKLEIIKSQYEFSSLLHDVISISRMRLGAKPLMFITDIDSTLPARMTGDEIRIKQILINLLSNAIKFTQEGAISLRVSGKVEEGAAVLCFEVGDTGAGIKEEDLERLFAEFERVNTTKNRSIEGTGLGLAISKQLCEMMDGRIEVKSTYGQGSVFTVIIPQECPEYERLAEVKEPKSVLLFEPRERYRLSFKETIENLDCCCVPCTIQSELYDNISLMPYDYILTSSLHLKKVQTMVKKNGLEAEVAVFTDYGEIRKDDSVYSIYFPVNCLQIADLLNGDKSNGNYRIYDKTGETFTAPNARVLVVDDNPVNLKVAEGLMSVYQFHIDTAENGLEAVEKVKENKYDLVFMDHMMPEMDGIDATTAIRQLDGEYYRNLPIIALTANALVGTREMFIREGMNDFLAKPIEIGKLSHVLSKWLPVHKKIKGQEESNGKPELVIPEWEIAGVNIKQGILSVGGSKDNYMQIMASYYADGISKCSSLMKHMTGHDLLAFKTEVHALKSTSATIGAVALSEMAARLERAAQEENWQLIDENIDEFLTKLQTMLHAMRPYVSDETASVKNRPPGDEKELKEILGTMYRAAEVANIHESEELLKKLEELSWTDEIQAGLTKIREALAVFDYDEVLECINGLNVDTIS